MNRLAAAEVALTMVVANHLAVAEETLAVAVANHLAAAKLYKIMPTMLRAKLNGQSKASRMCKT